MGNQEGKESDSVASAVAEWIDDDDEESDSKNDDESFASHSRSIHVEDETDTIAVSRSRSINIMPDEDEESEKGELTSHQRSIAFDILAEDERDAHETSSWRVGRKIFASKKIAKRVCHFG